MLNNSTYLTKGDKRKIKLELFFWRLLKFFIMATVYLVALNYMGKHFGRDVSAIGILSALIIWHFSRFRV